MKFTQTFGGDITKTRDWLGGIRTFVSARAPFFVSPDEGLAFIRGLRDHAATWASSFPDFSAAFTVPGDSLASCRALLSAIEEQFPNPTAASSALAILRRLRQNRTHFGQFIVAFESQAHITGLNAHASGDRLAAEFVGSIRGELRDAINSALTDGEREGDINSLGWAELLRHCLRQDPSVPFPPAAHTARTSPAPTAIAAPAPPRPHRDSSRWC